MIKPAIFIDAYLSDDNRLDLFNQNLRSYKDCGYDIFVISNRISHFEGFSNLKYFEYDSVNRILVDKTKYTLISKLEWWRELFCSDGLYDFKGESLTHGFTNWSILYNLKKMAVLLKKRGYTHLIRCEYDVVFKDYDLMKSVFKDYGLTEKSKKCMILPGGFGVTTNFFLIDVNLLIDKIPDMESESDYQKFLVDFYGSNKSPVFEELFYNLIDGNYELLNQVETDKNIKHLGYFISNGDLGYRHPVIYGSLFMTPINDNKQFFLCNDSETHTIYVDYKTNGFEEIYSLRPNMWLRIHTCKDFVEIKTSEMIKDHFYKFDLNIPCKFTFELRK